ncbi:MAG: hypothetical protein ACYDBH_23890 [Acidobacteriaceae bacterium]
MADESPSDNVTDVVEVYAPGAGKKVGAGMEAKVTLELALLVESATLVAFTVTVCAVAIAAGAV